MHGVALGIAQQQEHPSEINAAKEGLDHDIEDLVDRRLVEQRDSDFRDRVDQHSAPILSRAETIKHEQVLANDLIREYEHPVLGRVRQPRPAARFEGVCFNRQPIAPRLGEHNPALLAELGYTAQEIDEFVRQAIIPAV